MRLIQHGCLLLLAGLGLAGQAFSVDFSQVRLTQVMPTQALLQAGARDPATAWRGLKTFRDDILPSQSIQQVTLTAQEKHQAQVWRLTPQEEARYTLLRQNRSGVWWWDHLTPVEVLGLNARNQAERQRYAHLYAQQLQERVAKELAWQAAANDAKAKISRGLPIIRPFDTSRFSPLAYHPIVLAPHDQVFLLTRLTLNSTRLINTLLVQLQKQPSASLNIYFADHPSPQAVRAWVAKAGLPVQWIHSHRLTVNTDEGTFAQVPKALSHLPVLLQVRAGKVRVVDTARF